MIARLGLSGVLLAALTMIAEGAGPEAAIESGNYAVDVRLELPHMEESAATKSAVVCLSNGAVRLAHGLAVLSDNNPLAHCPISNIHEDGQTLTFDIVCPGGNAAVASAKFTLAPQGFDGRIAMKMGGKNMTMTEVQRGHRTGDCTAAEKPPS